MGEETDWARLLEMAAKAAGGLVYVPEIASWIHEDAYGNRGSWWRPLDDDGDALRLAVALRLQLITSGENVVQAIDYTSKHYGEAPVAGDRLAATRRAIVMAAAAIGEGMP